jgi:hypothetical protein
VTDEPLEAETEAGLPGKQNQLAISLPWIARFALTATLGAVIGYAASTAFPERASGPSGWIVILTGAIAASLFSFRRVHGWHVSTFVDGTLAGLAAAPIFMVIALGRSALTWDGGFTTASVMQGLQIGVLFVVFGALVTVPCGWVTGFVYHLLLSAAERARSRQDEDAQPS